MPRRSLILRLFDRRFDWRRTRSDIAKTFSDCPNLKGSVFVVTYGRSGSTLLQSLLQSIPGAHFSGENYAVLEGLYQATLRAHRTRTNWGKEDRPPNHPWHGASGIDPARFESKLAKLFVDEIIQPPATARWIGFKEIRYVALGDDLAGYLQFIRRTFPNAHFVFNSRRAEDVAKSKWWAKRPEDEVISLVERTDARFADYAKAYPDHSKHVSYDETVADPSSLKPVFDMLGEELDLDLAQSILSVRLNH